MSYRTRTQRNSNGRHHYQQEEESAEVALLRATHSQSLNVLKELFPDWSEEDLLFTLQDTYGDLELTVARISEGHASQWGEVKTRKPKKTPTYPRQKPRPQLRDTDTPQAQTLNIKPQHHRGKSVYHTDENGLLVASTESNAQQKSGQLSSEETICETLGLSTQTDWSQDLPTPLGTTQTNKGTFTSEKERGNDTTRGNRSEGHRKSSKSNKDILSGEKPQNGPGSTRGQKSRGRGGKSNSDSAHHSSSGNKIERGNSSRRRGGEGDNPSISNKTSRSKEKEPPVPKPAPVPENTWAKIASRATLPKPAPVQPPTTETNQSTVPEKIETSVSIETIAAVVSTQEEEVTEVVQKVDITSANISSGQEFSALDLIESLTNSEQKPADSPSNSSSNRHAPAVLIPNMMASKMGNISNKFAKMNLSDLGLDLSTEETAPPSTSDIKCPPAPDTEPATSAEKPKDSRPTEPASSVPATTPHSDKPIEFEVSSETITVTKASTETLDHQVGKSHPVVPEQNAKSKTNDATNISSTSGLDTVASSQAPPRPHTQVQPQPQVPSQSQPQAPSQPQPQVQPQVPTQVPSSKPLPPTSAGQNQDSLYQPPMNQYYQQSQGYGQMPMHTNGAPGQLLMQGQMMHPQGQANYMPYYPYPYGPTHYNPYQTNNYTHQFAQKSLNGNYEDNNPNSFGQLASGGGPNHPPENGNVTNHGYDKSAHGKHKNYPDPSNDSGISGHGPPMNYNNFGYGVMPNYQPSGTPGDGPVYYPHPYYTQPSHNMFLGYPCSAGQPVPPHQQHNYGNNTHPLQQHHQGHQGHQPHSQPQTHYASHQQSNSNNRYQSWNN